jgi:hypothetical protein
MYIINWYYFQNKVHYLKSKKKLRESITFQNVSGIKTFMTMTKNIYKI